MPLKLVPATLPTPKQEAIERIKKLPNVDGAWQCNRCGCRTVLNTENGVSTQDGRRQRGTAIDKDVCAECWKRGIHSPMKPEIKPVK